MSLVRIASTAAVLALFCTVTALRAQTVIEYVSDAPTDARSAALGEAYVAIAQGPAALFYNPAGIARQHGVAFAFDTRESFSPDYRAASQHHVGLSAAVNYGNNVFGVRYVTYGESHQYDNGGMYPVIMMVTSQTDISDVAVAYAGQVSPTLDCGAELGLVHRHSSFQSRGTVEDNHGAAYLSVGIRYHESLLEGITPDEFAFAASLSHFGAPLVSGNEAPPAIDLARAIRAGMAWRIAQPETTAFADEFLSAMISGQFKKVLNEGAFASDGVNTNKGYWSIGVEAGIYNLLFLRYGLHYRSYDSPYAYRNNGQSNVGLGARIPVHKLFGLRDPLWISVDYTLMLMLDSKKQSVLSAGVHLDRDLFTASGADAPEPLQR